MSMRETNEAEAAWKDFEDEYLDASASDELRTALKTGFFAGRLSLATDVMMQADSDFERQRVASNAFRKAKLAERAKLN